MKEGVGDSHQESVAVSARSRSTQRERERGGANTPTTTTTKTPGTTAEVQLDDDYNEWDFGVGNLIIDLDADIEKNNLNASSGSSQTSSPGSSTKTSKNSSTMEHQATVDKGLKMKIKRKNVGAKSETKHEIVKPESKSLSSTTSSGGSPGAGGVSGECTTSGGSSNNGNTTQMAALNSSNNTATTGTMDKLKQGAASAAASGEKDKPAKAGRVTQKKERSKEKANKNDNSASGSSNLANGTPFLVPQNAAATVGSTAAENSSNVAATVVETPERSNTTTYGAGTGKRETPIVDPYEFNAKVEDRIGFPSMKKIKVEKNDVALSPLIPQTHDSATETNSVGTTMEFENLGPCEPGTSVQLEGIVWHETENGVLVVNITWRGKTYVGTLLDATRHDWAPPRFNCDSPTSEIDNRTPKGRGKRRAATNTPVDYSGERKLRKGRRGTANGFQAPPSPAKSDISPAVGVKRKGRPPELDLSANNEDAKNMNKRSRSSSRSTPPTTASSNSNSNGTTPSSPTLIECPEPNCNKKYKHINGLRYHQNHAHQEVNNTQNEAEKGADSEESNVVDGRNSPAAKSDASPPTPTKAKLRTEKEKSPIDDNTPLSELAGTNRIFTSPSKAESKKLSDKTDGIAKLDQHIKESNAVKKGEKQQNTSIPIAGSVPTSTPVSHVFQIASGPLGSLTGMSVLPPGAANQNAGIATIVQPATNQIAVSTVTVPVGTVAIQSDPKDLKKSKSDKEACKTKTTMARPIVPAPSPHVHLTQVTGHPQMSPTLKPIQPKPTIMGEPSRVDPTLASLKEKKPKHKKSRKDKEGKVPPPKENVIVKEEPVCSVGMPVIQTASQIKLDDRIVDRKPVIDHSKPGTVISDPAKEMRGGNRTNRPPSSLAIHSPLQVSTASDVDHSGDNVQSPAYSDISDANESVPSLENESEAKPEKDSAKNEKAETPKAVVAHPSEHPITANYGGMYPYYGGHGNPPYLLPAIPNQHSAPGTPSTPGNKPEQPSPKPVDKGAGEGGKEERKEGDSKGVAGKEGQEKKKEGGGGVSMQHPQKGQHPGQQQQQGQHPQQQGPQHQQQPHGQHPQQQQMQQDYQMQQQKLLQQQLYGLPPHAQYQYMSAYGYSMDPAYHLHHMANDPHYKAQHEKYMEEERRRREAAMSGKPPGDGSEQSSATDLSKPSSAKPNSGEQKMEPNRSMQNRPASQKLAPTERYREKPLEGKPGSEQMNSGSGSGGSKDRVDQKLKDKQNENHQILKENIELKSQMDNREKYSYDQRMLFELQQEELQRYYMYQQQHLIHGAPPGHDPRRERPKPDGKMPESSKRPHPEATISKEQAEKAKEASKSLVGEPPKDMRRYPSDLKMKDSRERESSPLKVLDDKLMKGKDNKLSSPRGTPSGKDRVTPTSSTRGTPTSSSQPLASYPSPFLSHPYMQSPHYAPRPMGFDPNHPMERGIIPVIGYTANPSYLHPAQMRYHMSPSDSSEKEKAAAMISPGSHSSSSSGPLESNPKALDLLQQHASHYYNNSATTNSNSHKIHELKEAAKDGAPSEPHSSSTPGKSSEPSTTPTAPDGRLDLAKQHREYSNSPPTQRHLHTHHHTHVVGPAYPLYDPYSGRYLEGGSSKTAIL